MNEQRLAQHQAGSQSKEETRSAAAAPDQLRKLAIASLLEGGRRAFKLGSVEAGKEKYRYFKAVWDIIVIGHLGFAAPAAKFASVSELATYAHISRNTAARAVDALVRWNMVHIVGASRRPLLICVNPNAESWLIDKTVDDDAWLKMLGEWRTFCCCTQLELELPDFGAADPTLQQLLSLVNVANAATNSRPTVGQESGDRSTVGQEQRPTVGHKDRPTVKHLSQHTNVGVRVRSPLRLTSDAQEAQRVLKFLFDYLADDPRVKLDEEKKNPIWPALASLADWPHPLEVAVKDCKDSTVATNKNNAARIIETVKYSIGIDRWFTLFPNSKSQWTR